MKQALDTRTKLLTKNPWPLMIELSIPAVLGMVVVGLYNMMDHINTATLKDTFKGVYGQPIGTYMKTYRMKQAAALLRQTQETIAEIANQVGYENQSKFATAFRDVFKIAPAEYRKQNSGD